MRGATLLCFLVAVLAMGCTRIQPGWTDIPDSGLAQLRSFRLDTATSPEGLTGDERDLWDERRRLVRGLIREQLTAKGYREMINDPDFIVHFWGERGADYAQEHHYDEQKGTIDIRAIDPESSKWLWHGFASETIVRRLDAESEIREAVSMILEEFPRSTTALE